MQVGILPVKAVETAILNLLLVATVIPAMQGTIVAREEYVVYLVASRDTRHDTRHDTRDDTRDVTVLTVVTVVDIWVVVDTQVSNSIKLLQRNLEL